MKTRIMIVVLLIAISAFLGAEPSHIFSAGLQSGILKTSLSGGSGISIGNPSGAEYCIGIDASENYVYVNIYGGNRGVWRTDLNGGNATKILNIPLHSYFPDQHADVAVDNDFIFVGNQYSNRIAKANIDGSNLNLEFVNFEPPFGASNYGSAYIVLSPTHIYSGGGGNVASKRIYRANRTTGVVDSGFMIEAEGAVTGIAVDENYLYWKDRAGKIGRANLDGSNVNKTWIEGLDASTPFGILVDGNYIYAIKTGSNLHRYNKNGTEEGYFGTAYTRGLAFGGWLAPPEADFPAGDDTPAGDVTIQPTVDLNYAANQTIPEIPNPSFIPSFSIVLSGSGIVDITITTSAQYGSYYQNGVWNTESNSGGVIFFAAIDFDTKGDIPIVLGNQDAALPVTLSTFTASFVNQELTIFWSTQSEANNSHWNLWRAEENSLYEAVKLNNVAISGAGNTSEQTNYSYVDEKEVENHATYYYWLESVDYSGQSEFYGSISITINLPDNPEAPEITTALGLQQNYPNPFNPDTKIRFAVEEAGFAVVTIFNLKGQKMTTVFSGNVEAKSFYETIWNGKDDRGNEVSSGVYLYRLESGSKSETKRMLLIK
jgi:hypothetical protein